MYLETNMMQADVKGSKNPVIKGFGKWNISSRKEMLFESPLDKSQFVALVERYGRAQGEKNILLNRLNKQENGKSRNPKKLSLQRSEVVGGDNS